MEGVLVEMQRLTSQKQVAIELSFILREIFVWLFPIGCFTNNIHNFFSISGACSERMLNLNEEPPILVHRGPNNIAPLGMPK